ncbi:hypothetical protein TrVGV298_001546 [Trichoderma virens]|nr:hypothetical protein TrVGV298_001546 [Trichoderma virens]
MRWTSRNDALSSRSGQNSPKLPVCITKPLSGYLGPRLLLRPLLRVPAGGCWPAGLLGLWALSHLPPCSPVASKIRRSGRDGDDVKQWANQRVRELDGQPMSMQAVAAAAATRRHKSECETNVLDSWGLAALTNPFADCGLSWSWSWSGPDWASSEGRQRRGRKSQRHGDLGLELGQGRLCRVGL